MEISVEILEGLNRCVTISIPAKEIENEKAKRIKKIAKTAKTYGFRPGKVPLKIIEQQYGTSVRQDALRHIISSTLLDTLAQEKLNPAGEPEIDIITFDPDKPLKYKATFEIYPKIKPVTLNNVEVETLSAEITEADIDKTLENIRKQHTKWEQIDRPAENGDQVIIDFEGFVDNQPIEGGKASEVPVVLGSNSMIPKFEAGIVGAKAGDEFEIEAQFPDNYYNKELSDKPAQFKIKLHKVSEPKLPELNDEFSQRLGVEGGLVTLREKIRETMEHELKNILKQRNKMIILNKLLELNKTEVPTVLVENEIEHLRQQAVQQVMKYAQQKTKTPDMPKELFEKEAKLRVTLGLLINELIRLYDIKPSKERIQTFINEITAHHKHPEQVIAWYRENPKQLQQIEMIVAKEEVVNKLSETAKVHEKQISFDELTKLPAEAVDSGSVISV